MKVKVNTKKEGIKTASSIILVIILVLSFLLTWGALAEEKDSYEPDNNYNNATPISVDSTQTHNFIPPGDVDWLVFNTATTGTYTVYTSDLAEGAGTNIYLYNNLSGLTLLDSYTGGGRGNITWTVDNTALVYYIQLNSTNESATQTQYNVTLIQTTPTPSPTPAPKTRTNGGSTTSGGGGGGGGGVVVEDYENILEQEKHEGYVYMGRTASYIFSRNSIVTQVNFTGKTNYGEATIQVEVLKNIPRKLNLTPSGEVYRYFNVRIGGPGFASPQNIEDLEVRFKVEKSWAQDKTVTLSQFQDGKWTEATTTKIGEDSTHIYFKGLPPGLTPYYAITAPAPEPLTPATPAGHPPPTSRDEKNGNGVKPQTTGLPRETPGFTLVMTVLAGFYAYVYLRK